MNILYNQFHFLNNQIAINRGFHEKREQEFHHLQIRQVLPKGAQNLWEQRFYIQTKNRKYRQQYTVLGNYF